MAETGDLLTRIYGNFRGADFRGEEINLGRSPDCLNVWRDYKKITSIETRPGMELDTAFEDTVYGIFFYTVNDTELLLVHSGTKLYKVENGTKTELYSGLNDAPSDGFVYNSTWYFKDGKNYLQYDGKTIKDVEGYVPTTTIGITAIDDGTGPRTPHEDVNLLSPYRINTMRGNGAGKEFQLDAQEIDSDFAPEVTIDGQKVYDTVTVEFYESRDDDLPILVRTVKCGENVEPPVDEFGNRINWWYNWSTTSAYFPRRMYCDTSVYSKDYDDDIGE